MKQLDVDVSPPANIISLIIIKAEKKNIRVSCNSTDPCPKPKFVVLAARLIEI